jgi:hypothetical protein
MSDVSTLIPPADVIHERLTKNQRERKVLRDLLRLSVRATEVDLKPVPLAADRLKPASQRQGA